MISIKEQILVWIANSTILQSRGYGDFQILEYKDSYNVLVKFISAPEHRKWVQSVSIVQGCIKDPYHPSVYGVGYMGEGVYKRYVAGKNTKESDLWVRMLDRCYANNKEPAYEGCTVCDEWHNFQNFAEWCQGKKGFDQKGWDLDKDIVVKGNKVYGPETCVFIPKVINGLFGGRRSGKSLPTGVFREKGKEKFRVGVQKFSSFVHIGVYSNLAEALFSYKKEKELHIKEVAEMYKCSIDSRVYNSLINWEIYIPVEILHSDEYVAYKNAIDLASLAITEELAELIEFVVSEGGAKQ